MYEPPQWVFPLLLSIGLLISVLLTYREFQDKGIAQNQLLIEVRSDLPPVVVPLSKLEPPIV